MFELLKSLFGFGPKVDFASLVKEGALILDVRTKGEFESGHIKGSLNIPVDQLGSQLGKLKEKDRVIITCCASGMRSAAARNILRGQGYTRVYNGGGWASLQRLIR
jgi:rhodanese-related sulfurtransferase